MNVSLFDRLDESCIRTDPFPHAVLEAALPEDLCAHLIATRPPSAPSKREGVRIAYPAWMLQSIPSYDPAWAALAVRHIRADNLSTIRRLFRDHWHDHLPEPPEDSAAYGTLWRDTYETHDVLCDARLELISPNPSAPTSHRQQHLDAGNRLFSALYYLRAPEDDSEGGGLSLFRYHGARPDRLDVNEFDDTQVETVLTVPYQANTLVVFPNCPDAIHGSEIRQPTAHDRAYLFVTAEVEKDLF